jgi:small-conductance mechanosensitive channel
MNRLQPWQFGLAAAVTFSVVYTACALAVALFPDGTIAFFNAWFHGLDLTLLKPRGGRPLTLSQFFYGLASAAVVSFAIATTLAAFYNVFVRASTRS